MARTAGRVPRDMIDSLMDLMDTIQEYVNEMKRMVRDLEARGPSEVEAFNVEEPVRLRKTDGLIGIVRVTNDDGWVGVEWPHSVTEWVRADELQRA